MGQIFHPATNAIAKVSIFGGLIIVGLVGFVIFQFNRSSYMTQVGVAIEQPIPFSHKHHVDGLGIDCRFCHNTVETSPFAGIPSTETCMKCHSQVWNDSPMLAPVRESFATGEPIEWNRVHDLPDYVYFDHSIHVSSGVSCVSCHGQVDQMPLTWRANTLHMGWCLSCHRNPEPHLRPKGEVFNMNWDPSQESPDWHPDELPNQENMTNCSICHR